MKKILAPFLAVVMAISLAGCNSSNKPESTVTNFCDALKNYDLETASSYVVSGSSNIESPYTDENTSEQSLFTENLTKYVTNWAKEMTYVLGETAIDGDTATIPVTFTYVDASPVISETLKEYVNQAFTLVFSGADDFEAEDLLCTIFMEKAESVSTETAMTTVEFVCIKQDKEWKIQGFNNDALYGISNVISCNMAKAIASLGNGLRGDGSTN